MNRTLGFAALGIVFALAATLVIVPRVAAQTPCFPDVGGHWAETFICWLQSKGIVSGYGDGTYRPDNNVTRGEMAVYIQRVADVPPTTGLILVSVSPREFMPAVLTDPLTFTYGISLTEVSRSATGHNYLAVHPDVPTVLYGRSLQLMGVEFCYGAVAGTTLDHVQIYTYTQSTGPSGFSIQRLSDETSRNDFACRLYSLGSPYVLTADDAVILNIGVEWTSAYANFQIGRTTFVFEATDINAAAP